MKLAESKTRDRVVNRVLRRAGWKVVRIWEHELQRGKHSIPHCGTQHSTSKADKIVQRILEKLRVGG
jgi:G:T-mismatch repair DNA endonuclease (very short patch repair protein)